LLSDVVQAEWKGLVDASAVLKTNGYSFAGANPEAGETEERHYGGDFGDIDGDGLVDRILGSRYGLLFNSGGGLMVPARKQFNFLKTKDANANAFGNAVFQFADLDGDGDLDAISGSHYTTTLAAQLNRGGRFTVAWQLTGANRSALDIVSTDLERDGDVDLVIASAGCRDQPCGHTPTFALLVNDGSGKLKDESAQRGLPYGAGDYITGVASGDVDGDGDFDLVISHGLPNALQIAFNDGSGKFTTKPTPLGAVCGGFGQALSLGDIDDDGDLDIVNVAPCAGSGGHPTVGHTIGINDGKGAFLDASATRLDAGGFAQLPEIRATDGDLADIDHDGDLDLVAFQAKPKSHTHMMVYLNDGLGKLTYSTTHSVFSTANVPASIFGTDLDVADVDRDGDLDVFVAISGTDARIHLNQHRDPAGLAADVPRAVKIEDASSSGIRLSWDPPPFAATARHYRVYRATAPGLEARDKQLVKIVGMSMHQDEGFSAPITRHTTTSYLGDPDVTLAAGRVTFIDRTAQPGVRYYYSVAHVGSENVVSAPSAEVNAIAPPGNDAAPTLEIGSPTSQDWSRYPRIVLHYGDGLDDLDPSSLVVSFDRPLGGGAIAAGANLASQAYRHDGNAFIAWLAPPHELPVGAVTMTASIRDKQGHTTTRKVTFTVSSSGSALPKASLAVENAGANPLALSAGASSDPDGKVTRWEWYFGDGTTGLGRDVVHAYAKPGEYQVTLRVRDDDGGVALATHTVTITAAPSAPPADHETAEPTAEAHDPIAEAPYGCTFGGTPTRGSYRWLLLALAVMGARRLAGFRLRGSSRPWSPRHIL
jgi:hypothetical protein